MELRRGDGADAPQPLDGQRVEELELRVGGHNEQPVGLRDPARHLGEELRPRDADRDRQADVLPDVAAQPRCDLGHVPARRSMPRTSRNASSIESPSTRAGRVLEHPEHGLARLGVGGHPRPDDDRVRAEPPCLAAAHCGADAVGLRLVARREDDARPDDHRPAAEPRIVPLLDRRVEGVDVRGRIVARPCEHMFAHRGGRPLSDTRRGRQVAAGSRTASTLYATTGRWNPLSTNSPAGSTSTASSTSAETLRDEDLARGRLVGEPRREVRHRSDRRVVGAALEPHLAAGA